ncbi:MAG TPA: universal stress protein [Gemmatimonadaceae bacterium]|nr:universal stress protein [Gemmatimonadaceae bacterium]HRQ77433.1 universal stress protein [Gemmatimonadaceae bacterium]
MAFRSLLVPLDLSPLADRVLARVALLPFASRAKVTLLHVVPTSLSLSATRRAVRDAKETLTRERGQLLKELPKHVTVTMQVKVGAAPAAIAAAAARAKADLVVMGRGSPRGLRDAFLGSTAERVIRRSHVPVLAVRNPARNAYRRPMVALDLDDGAHDVVTLLQRLLTEPQPSVDVVHAFDVPFRQMRYPNLTDEDFAEVRDHYRQEAMDGLMRIIRSQVPAAEIPRWTMHAKFGNPRAVVLKAATQEKTDLLALATHGYRGVAHAFLGTVAGDVLRHVNCDVLVVPPNAAAGRRD